MDTLSEWINVKDQLDILKKKELELRTKLAPKILGDKIEGSKTGLLGEYKLQATGVINYTIDEAELIIRKDELDDAELAAILYKPKLKLAAYKKLDAQSTLRRIVSARPGLVQLKVVEYLGE